MEDEHPLDGPLGEIHAIAIELAIALRHDLAERLAVAHEQIQKYLVEKEI